jgi:hypothetical protein
MFTKMTSALTTILLLRRRPRRQAAAPITFGSDLDSLCAWSCGGIGNAASNIEAPHKSRRGPGQRSDTEAFAGLERGRPKLHPTTESFTV